ncbi:component of SufBCD complex [Salipiger sp. CCB-MM3]|uniref:component of SufBCD complex n=1 Tax=Roseobacteraceae TaxID=2854170 RepID=UPI00080AAE34|nr:MULTISPECIES: component of SufBCD complex [Roseobacteraceae]ANT61103.1 component of SufBCD complex [Salipiger sp. CCB-MM3]MCA0994332.1 component of SufBCD complex [Alloyangia pacifica]
MDLTGLVSETIDLRSFSNLWFWIALAVTWSSTSHWVLGVPFDMVGRARRQGGQAALDLEDMVRINVNRRLFIIETAGLWVVGLGAAVLTMLASLGFWYDIELAQALFLLGFPLSLVGLMGIATAERIRNRRLSGEALWRKLTVHRFWTQVIGMISIFVTAMWGMYQNLGHGVLG